MTRQGWRGPRSGVGFLLPPDFSLFSYNNGVVMPSCRELDSTRSALSAASAFAIATAGANEGTPTKEKYRRMSLASAGTLPRAAGTGGMALGCSSPPCSAPCRSTLAGGQPPSCVRGCQDMGAAQGMGSLQAVKPFAPMVELPTWCLPLRST